MYCKEICFKYEAARINPKSEGRYKLGFKRCSNCEIFIIWDGYRCPCCKTILRVKPRNAKSVDKII